MTGLGGGRAALGEGTVELEVRALNHRFLELRVRLPAELQDQTLFLEQELRRRLGRGRYDVTARLDGHAVPPPVLDRARARAAHQALRELRDELEPGTPVGFAAIAALPHVVVTPGLQVADARRALTAALELALAQLGAMQRTEGATLRAELTERCAHARESLRAIVTRLEEGAGALRARLRARTQRLVGELGVSVDTPRLEAELVLLAERADPSEELSRITAHLAELERLAALDEPVGRRLDFLLQELARESNTLAAKCGDALAAHRVVELRAELERMREQVQNVE